MNKQTIITGTLIFIVGVAMVACGNKNSGSSATPAANSTATATLPVPATNGTLAQQTSACSQSTGCSLSGTFRVSNPQAFVEMAGSNRFAGTNGTVPISNLLDPNSWYSMFGSLFGNCGLNLTFNGNVGAGCGTTYGTTGTTGAVTNAVAYPTTSSSYSMAVTYYQANQKMTGSITLGNGNIITFDANGQAYNGAILFVDQVNRVYLQPVSANQINVATVSNGQLVQAGAFYR